MELIVHMREEGHEDNPVVKCSRCKEEMPLLDTESHMKRCALEDNVKCSFCPKAFKKGSFGLHAHMRQGHFSVLSQIKPKVKSKITRIIWVLYSVVQSKTLTPKIFC